MLLALTLGKTLGELRQVLFSDELILWQAFYHSIGFPNSRVEAAIAISGSAFCNSLGNKVKPADLLPRFQEKRVLKGKAAIEALNSWATGVNKTTRIK